MKVAFLVLVLVAFAAPAGADSRLPDNWPDVRTLSDVVEEKITFDSSSPFAPDDMGAAEPTDAVGHLFLPPDVAEGRAAERSVPAAVLVHGAGGVRSARELTYGRQLASMGVVALVVDSFAARSDRANGFVERVLEITESMLVADVYAALGELAARPEIDTDRVVLIGFSYGGMASMYSLSEPIAARLAPDGLRFAGHVAFYGPCVARFEETATTGASLLMMYGDGDELIDADRCLQIAEDFRAGGSEVEIIVYPGAVHQWDGGMSPHSMPGVLTACNMTVSPDGTVWDQRTFLPMTGPLLRRAILAACVEDKPFRIKSDDAVRLQSNRDLAAFLNDILYGHQDTITTGSTARAE